MTLNAAPALLGFTLGLGLWLTVVGLPILRQPSFGDRIAGQFKVTNIQSRLLSHPTRPAVLGPLERVLAPLLRDLVAHVERVSPSKDLLTRRLARAGTGQEPGGFRAEQIVWSTTGLMAGLMFSGATAASGRFSIVPAMVLIVGGAVGGFIGRDYLLSAQIRRRERRMLTEFPSLADMMALAVSAGDSATGALERICRTSHGELAGEFRRVLADTRSGTPLMTALSAFSRRMDLPPLVRFVDGVTVAVERGTPLADVLRAQAQDARDVARRELMESAGRKEIGMMVPLVFGVLPLTVVFAVYPGVALIYFGTN